MGSNVVNAKLVSGDFDGFQDIGNPFTLAKSPSINTIWLMGEQYWLQWSQSEVNGLNIDVASATVIGDTSYRSLITGNLFRATSSGPVSDTSPQQTNLYYATDPSQRGTNPVGAYPYVTFDLGIDNPAIAPTAATAVASGVTTTFQAAQETSVNNAVTVNPGAAYTVGETLNLVGGTLSITGEPAQVTVTSVNPTTGAITGVTILEGGFYQNNEGPGSTTINHSGGYSLPTSSIQLTSVAGMSTTGGSISVQNNSGVNQTVNYTSITGTTLNGCSGGSGTISNGAAVQPTLVTVGSTGAVGSGATFSVTVVPQQGTSNTPSAGWSFATYNNGAGSYGTFSVSNNQWLVSSGEGGFYVIYSTGAYGLKTSTEFTFQVDATSQNNGYGEYCDLIFQFSGQFNGNAPGGQVVGPTLALSVVNGSLILYPSIVSGGSPGVPVVGSPISTAMYSFAGGTQYRVTISAIASTNSSTPGFSVVASVANTAAPNTKLTEVSGFIPYSGEEFGVGTVGRVTNGHGQDGSFENILITSTQPASNVTTDETNYVSTYEQLFNSSATTYYSDESGPSDPSNSILVYINGNTNPSTWGPASVSVPAAPSGQNIAWTNIYRAVTTSANTAQYQLDAQLTALTLSSITGVFQVGETVTDSSGNAATVLTYGSGTIELNASPSQTLPINIGDVITGGTSGAVGTIATNVTAGTVFNYQDTLLDEDLGEVIVSSNFAPPPSNLMGICALPNGIMAGYFANTLCLSAQYYPQAWPVDNQYATDSNIVALAIFGNTVLVLTQGNPYTAYGTDPGNFIMNKEPAAQGCISKRSVATHKVYGAIYASGSGLCYYRGQGQFDLIRRTNANGELTPLFTASQWNALNPSSIIGVVRDDYYMFWWNNGSTKGGYIVDLAPGGFGIVALDYHVTSCFDDTLADALYFTPDYSVYPINGSVVAAPSNVVSQWEYEGSTSLRKKEWQKIYDQLNFPTAFTQARVYAQDYSDITLTLANENGTLFNGVVTNNMPFPLAALPPGSQISRTIVGKSVVQRIEMVERTEEFTA